MHLLHFLHPSHFPFRIVAALGLACGLPAFARSQSIDFAQEIRPLLSDRCFACHGPDEEHRESDLRVDQWASLIEDRGDYQVLVPGNAGASEMMRRIQSQDPSEIMPPPDMGKPLSAEEQETIRRWIESGAEWKRHWAYETPRIAPVPPNASDRTGANWIDAFIAAEHGPAEGHFSEPADRATLVRRLALDMTGLPPSADDLVAVLKDPAPEALERYLERLLASPAFGERLATYWLDLVRYADTVGYHGDQDHNISPYRDYVVNSFNDNRPFDQFTLEQLAGDLLPSPTDEQIIATGYNRLLQTTHEGGAQAKEYLAIYAADRVRNLSAVWMGATVGCAQCHDHKYDPYTSRDFYALAAFFADIDEARHFKVGTNALPTKRPPEQSFLSRSEKLQLSRLEAKLERSKRAESAEASGPDQASEQLAERKKLEEEIRRLKDGARLTMVTVSIPPREVRFLPRGNWLDDSGEVMQAAVPEFLGVAKVGDAPASRLDLAHWLTDTENGAGLLTARVFVNRLWMIYFGTGLSRSVEDFGGQGEPPSHPELLDQLALEFVRSGWDIKHLVRLLTATRTYRQSSLETEWHRQQDPLNRLFTRQNRFRVSAETVRDAALACSGLLVHRIGGPSVKPYQPAAYYRHLNFPTRKYHASDDLGQWRRGLYVHWQRQFLHPMLRAFDAPTREECTAQRPQSNTPLAALVWLNDPSFIEAAKGLALRMLAEDDGTPIPAADEERLLSMFQWVTSRRPDAIEIQTLKELLAEFRGYYREHPDASAQILAVGLFRRQTDLPKAEIAAWMGVARAVLNLNETYTRN